MHGLANGRLPLSHSQASSRFIGSDSNASDTNQMVLWNRLAPRTVGPGRRGPVSVQTTLALADFLSVQYKVANKASGSQFMTKTSTI